jgi:hypothetical protein
VTISVTLLTSTMAPCFPHALRAASAALVLTCAGPCTARAQSLEPRSYSNAPVGLNFVLVGAGYSKGDVATDPSLPIEDANAEVYSGFVGYARVLNMWGQAGQIGLLVPYAHVDANGLIEGLPRSVSRNGFGDPIFRLTANLYGAPALSPEAFAAYRQDTIVGVSLLVTAPWGQYYSDKLINIGTNRWSFKPEFGVSKALGRWIVEGAAAATFFTANDAFYPGANTREQDPLYSLQGHAVYNLSAGAWAALDATYYIGGRTTVNGVLKNDLQQNLRWGATLALPVDRRNSVKLYFSSGVFTRVGSDFTTVGMAWQYRWGAGL